MFVGILTAKSNNNSQHLSNVCYMLGILVVLIYLTLCQTCKIEMIIIHTSQMRS